MSRRESYSTRAGEPLQAPGNVKKARSDGDSLSDWQQAGEARTILKVPRHPGTSTRDRRKRPRHCGEMVQAEGSSRG